MFRELLTGKLPRVALDEPYFKKKVDNFVVVVERTKPIVATQSDWSARRSSMDLEESMHYI